MEIFIIVFADHICLCVWGTNVCHKHDWNGCGKPDPDNPGNLDTMRHGFERTFFFTIGAENLVDDNKPKIKEIRQVMIE